MSLLTSPPTWFITGASSGFGWSIAQHALKAGHNVVATSRNPSKTPILVNQVEVLANGHWMAFDVNQSDIRAKIAEAESVFGSIDVLVNNAGYAQLGAFEDISEKDARMQMETNFFAPLKIIQATLPGMRSRSQDGKSRAIVNISSGAGLLARPGLSMYAASKHALEAISESMSTEIAPFNIRMLLVEPGFFRTNMSVSGITYSPLSEGYKDGAADTTIQGMQNIDYRLGGDPDKAAKAIFDVITGEGRAKDKRKVLRLLLGKTCVERVRDWLTEVGRDIGEMEDISVDTQ